jgi:hypothetical protein
MRCSDASSRASGRSAKSAAFGAGNEQSQNRQHTERDEEQAFFRDALCRSPCLVKSARYPSRIQETAFAIAKKCDRKIESTDEVACSGIRVPD